MCRTKPKKTLQTELAQNGFTILEALLSLIITMMILSFIPLFYQEAQKINQLSDLTSENEWLLFRTQFLAELQGAHTIRVSVNAVSFIDQEEKQIVYQQYKNLVRRQVNGRGHEPILQNVQKTHFHEINDEIILAFTSYDGKQHFLRFRKENDA
ncbi:competence type IV pilus minor pilin ComGF [Listeria ilorinensis]|uniref:competence type IV pilus minor pilin ComGF n=1 Tax=Listeria ilorinensis TaxID=2867439 RepID=UPI001EF6FDC7|nr:competence type IV pilus minor pilin ComGF [Listeria ilorinensis]